MLYLILLGLAILGNLGHASWTEGEDNQTPILRHNNGRNVSVALFSDLEELARIVDISYCVGLTSFGISKPFACLSRCSDFPTFELVTTWNTGPLLSDSCGYIALDHGKQRIVVAFRGTYSIANTIVDLSTVPQKYEPYPGEGDAGSEPSSGYGSTDISPQSKPKCLNCTVHWGFHTSWLNTRKQILPDLQKQVYLHPDYRLELVGHSLGGAVAALAGLDFLARGWNPAVTTFGEPRIGNLGLAKYIDQRFDLTNGTPENDTALMFRRVTHLDDPVPLLPLSEWGYAMHAGEIFISKPDLSPNIRDLELCNGDVDPKCVAGQDSTASGQDPNRRLVLAKPQGLERERQLPRTRKQDLLTSVKDEIEDVKSEPWGIPSRYKLWRLFFAHRDYFWRLGLCVPGGDPLGGGGTYDELKQDL